jgi:peptide-methionine (S)-S-oxide reductase
VATIVLVAASLGAAAAPPRPVSAAMETATFAGGCFWSMEFVFDQVDGVVATTAGYMGGRTRHPTYDEVAGGRTGHAEVIQVRYDPARVPYARLLEVFWRNVDPTARDRQFCDVGSQYRTTIFYHGEAQRQAAEASKAALAATKPFKGEIVTPIVAAGEFWPAEAEHQDYYLTSPNRYAYYRATCGRDQRLQALWGSPPK